MMNLSATMPGGPGISMEQLTNEQKRKKREALVTPRDNYSDGPDAMKEIFERKRDRAAHFQEMKMADYRERCGLTFDECTSMNFADAEYRRAIKDGKMKGAFAGDGMSFPIASPEDVRRAWSSVGRSNQDTTKIQKNIIRIARKYGWMSGLPKSVHQRIKKGGSGLPE